MPVGRFPLCLLLLKNDSNYPWFILVPEREGVTEIFELSQEDQTRLILESSQLSEHLATAFMQNNSCNCNAPELLVLG